MQHLFTPAGEAALAALVQRRPLLAFDFDGTLAPIVARPDHARPPLGVSARLATLAQRLPVAIVTGRRIDDVRPRLGFVPTFVVGNHGIDTDAAASITPTMAAAMERMRARIGGARAALQEAGVTVEDKGSSIALHYRLSRTRERAIEVVQGLLKNPDDGLSVFGGKMVANIVPRDAPDKAHAVRELLERSGASCALFAGDDINDEPVFAAAPTDWLTIRVGRDERRSAARYCLDSPAEVGILLERILAQLPAQ